MKNQLLTFAMAAALSPAAWAANTVEKVAQVTNAVTLTEDVDYTITGETPFTTTGSINLTNTEHAVIIFENIRPSDAFSYLGFIQINGEDAVDGENCQVKMYASGTIIMPYGKDFKPLTVYSEPDFGGESANDFGTEHSGGYMNTLTAAKLNNRIRSFKLKRGYMVTFSNSPRGRGYSRCFIADKEDLEFAELPKEMDGKISSYRVFQWYNYEKKGIASDGGALIVDTLNVTWCYDWGQGNGSNLPDAEWVPHHIYEDWPSVATCGSVTQSCHMQTNNEPGNSADDHPQDVETVLNNWENLMATGMRLCSPSSHDGSLNWLRAFMDSIDARGWRCDILDMHCCPGGQTGDNIDDSYGYPWLFTEASHQDEFVAIWEKIAARYADEPVILGYDFMNEPISSRIKDKDMLNTRLQPLMIRVAQAVRKIDPNHIFFIGGAQWNGNFKVFDNYTFDSNMAFTCHTYQCRPEVKSLLRFTSVRDESGIPMYMGETGENTDEWVRGMRMALDSVNIGWTFWPYKKLGSSSSFVKIGTPEGWDTVCAFLAADRSSYARISEARPDQAECRRILSSYLDRLALEKCETNDGYIKALGLEL